ncbi:hypothetical protein QQS15_12675 [Bacillus pumilus]|uniref:hypothetical protein n=1 Tax=Bacillus pumilus TaxID=1408 RepID=UPI00345E3B57
MRTMTLLQTIIQDDRSHYYPLFREYCERKEQGLRKDALKVLQSFIEEMKQLDFETQRVFVAWLFEWIEQFEDGHHLLVFPLTRGIIIPVFQEWMKLDRVDVRPYRWQGLFVHQGEGLPYLLKAGSEEHRVIVHICEIYLAALWYSFHHIHEDLYLSTFEMDQERIQGIQDVMMLIQDERTRTYFQKQADYYAQLLSAWIEFQQTETIGFMK